MDRLLGLAATLGLVLAVSFAAATHDPTPSARPLPVPTVRMHP